MLKYRDHSLNQRTIMASQINIYSQLSISTIRIVDISNSNYGYQQLELSISTIIVNVAKAQGRICNSYGGHEGWCWIGAKDVRCPRHKQRKKLIRIHIYAWIRIVDIHNSNCGYQQLLISIIRIADINNWNCGYR